MLNGANTNLSIPVLVDLQIELGNEIEESLYYHETGNTCNIVDIVVRVRGFCTLPINQQNWLYRKVGHIDPSSQQVFN